MIQNFVYHLHSGFMVQYGEYSLFMPSMNSGFKQASFNGTLQQIDQEKDSKEHLNVVLFHQLNNLELYL